MILGNSLILFLKLSILNSLIILGYTADNTNYPTTQISSSECYDNYGLARVCIRILIKEKKSSKTSYVYIKMSINRGIYTYVCRCMFAFISMNSQCIVSNFLIYTYVNVYN